MGGAGISGVSDAVGSFLIGNTQKVHADQMVVVAAGSARKSVSEATQWLNSLSPGLPRDHGMRGLAGHFTGSDPARAFSFATAAEAAWLRAFSGG
jgi:hypothetical protein